MTIFLAKGKRVFHVLILSLACLGDSYDSGRLSYRQTSTCLPHHMHYVCVVVFVCPYVCTTLASYLFICFQKYYQTGEDGGVLGYPIQDSQHKIPLITY